MAKGHSGCVEGFPVIWGSEGSLCDERGAGGMVVIAWALGSNPCSQSGSVPFSFWMKHVGLSQDLSLHRTAQQRQSPGLIAPGPPRGWSPLHSLSQHRVFFWIIFKHWIFVPIIMNIVIRASMLWTYHTSHSVYHFMVIFLSKKSLYVYLAMPGLRCSTWDLPFGRVGS